VLETMRERDGRTPSWVRDAPVADESAPPPHERPRKAAADGHRRRREDDEAQLDLGL